MHKGRTKWQQANRSTRVGEENFLVQTSGQISVVSSVSHFPVHVRFHVYYKTSSVQKTTIDNINVAHIIYQGNDGLSTPHIKDRITVQSYSHIKFSYQQDRKSVV